MSTATKKPAAKKPVAKKPAAKKPFFDPGLVGRDSAQNMQMAAKNIDRQMKKLASIDTRVLIAKDKLAELQELIQLKGEEFQEKNTAAAKRALENTRKRMSNHKDIMKTIREARAEAATMLKESKSIHKAYESIVNHLEKGKATALKEAKKAEISFMKKLHKVEAKMLKTADNIKKNIKR